jgi:GNAT superfamily N-acetyltransferase
MRQEHIRTFSIEVNLETAGWAQLVTLHPTVAYLNQLYVLQPFRRRGLGTALVQRAQMEAARLGKRHLVLVSSEEALGMYRTLGYEPLVYFTAFRPKQPEAD